MLPGLDRLWLSRAAAALVARHPPPAGPPLVDGRLQRAEPRLSARHRVAADDPGGAATALAGGGEALVSSREEAMFQQALAARGLSASALGSVAGTDYSNGQRMVLTLYRVERGREPDGADSFTGSAWGRAIPNW